MSTLTLNSQNISFGREFFPQLKERNNSSQTWELILPRPPLEVVTDDSFAALSDYLSKEISEKYCNSSCCPKVNNLQYFTTEEMALLMETSSLQIAAQYVPYSRYAREIKKLCDYISIVTKEGYISRALAS